MTSTDKAKIIADIRSAAGHLREISPAGSVGREVAALIGLIANRHGQPISDAGHLWCSQDGEQWPCPEIIRAHDVARAVQVAAALARNTPTGGRR